MKTEEAVRQELRAVLDQAAECENTGSIVAYGKLMDRSVALQWVLDQYYQASVIIPPNMLRFYRSLVK